MLYIGCHLSISNGYVAMVETALSIGANTFQYFTRNPRGSSYKKPGLSEIRQFSEALSANGMHAPMAHAPYTFNPCAAEERILDYTADKMKEDIDLLENIPGAMYNFHPGSHVGQGADVGLSLCAKTLEKVISDDQKTLVLIETMSGKGSEIGKTFEQIRQIIDYLPANKAKHVGVCLDTCHVHDGGYDISNEPGKVLVDFDDKIGLDRLYAVHLNDSKNPLGAHKDRHEKIGEGYLGLEGIKKIVKNPLLKDKPFYLETPNELDGYKKEIELIKSF